MLLGLKPLLCKEASKIQKLKIFEAFESFLMFGVGTIDLGPITPPKP
jgi:hypothetical protein